jgi:uncharacterized protein (DUF58 family)
VTRLPGVMLLGAGVTAAAVAFGSRPLGVAGIGLLFAAAVTWAWAGLARGPVSVRYASVPEPATEGDRVRLEIEARRASRVLVGSLVVQGRLGRLGAHGCRLDGHWRRATGRVDLGRPPRGHFALTDVQLDVGDHLGLHSTRIPVEIQASVVVHPRLVELQSLFSDAGRFGGDGRRVLLRRAAGFDFHSVREYEQGESLRRVHWPTTAKRGHLMVKELEDSPRDEVVVLLDCDPAGAAGEPPDSSFDEAVRAAGSVLDTYARRGRAVTLVTTGRSCGEVRLRALEPYRRRALDVLAAAEPDALHSLGSVLARGRFPGGSAGELVVVTASLEPRTVERLVGAALGRFVSVVWIDAPSYAGRPTRTAPGLLRLAAAGIPAAVVRQGCDLAAALDVPGRSVAARA